MTIHFKNGQKKDVDQTVADAICKSIIGLGTCFEIFHNQGTLKFLIDMDEIVYID